MRIDPAARSWRSRARAVLPFVVTVALFLAGGYALWSLLGALSYAEVIRALHATPWVVLALAALATAGGYSALAGYDVSALDFIGKRAPLRSAMLAGFIGSAVGANLGLAAVTGAAARYRIYVRHGLGGFDVAAIAAFGAVAYGFGVCAIGFAALVVHPGAMGAFSPFPPGLTRLAALAATLVAVGPILWVSITGAALKLGRFTLTAPRPRLLSRQMLLTALDVTLAALSLWILLPAGAPDYFTFLAVYAAASMAGIMSHVPGGVGVFEVVIMAALKDHAAPEQLAAALLLWRAIYFLAPLGLALTLLLWVEVALGGKALRRVRADIAEGARVARRPAPK